MDLFPLIEVRGKKYVCRICGKELDSFFELNAHMFGAHKALVDYEFYTAKGIEIPESLKEELLPILNPEEYEKRFKHVGEGDKVVRLDEYTFVHGKTWEEVVWNLERFFGAEMDPKQFKEKMLEYISNETGQEYDPNMNYYTFLKVLRGAGYIMDVFREKKQEEQQEQKETTQGNE